jgi:serine/threonine protein kinase
MCSQGFVIKHLRKEFSSAGSKVLIKASRELINEAAFLARLDHPHILKPRACVSTGTLSDDSFGLILDRLDCTLLEKIDQWKFEQRDQPMKDSIILVDRLCYALEIAEALEYVHDRRLIYRDLSPRNIGFKNNSIQLFDFGLCRELPSRSLAFGTEEIYHMTYAGTARYLAPEVHRRKGYNLKADVYSWAIVCYEMISLIKPYEGMDRREHYTEVCCEGVRPCMDDLPRSEDLEELLHQTWCETLRDRLSMKEVCEVLEEIIASTDPETREAHSPIDEELYVDDESESTGSTLSVDSWLSDDDSIY